MQITLEDLLAAKPENVRRLARYLKVKVRKVHTHQCKSVEFKLWRRVTPDR